MPAPVLLALVSAEPNGDAFVGGLQLGLSAAFIVIAALVGLSIVRRMLGS
jgi:hypothetical protein